MKIREPTSARGRSLSTSRSSQSTRLLRFKMRAMPARLIPGSSRLRVYEGSEASGFEDGAGDVVAEVAEAECGAAEVFESSVGGLGGAVGGGGAVEERKDVARPGVQGPAEFAYLDQGGRDAGA